MNAQLPKLPEDDVELKRLRRDYEEMKTENERLRTEGQVDRTEMGKRTRELYKLRQKSEELEDELQAK